MEPFDNYPRRGRALIRRLPSGVARRGYARDVLKYCRFRCAYCALDMAVFSGWLQLSVDHVIPQQMVAIGWNPAWVLDEFNVIACCRSCNDLFNRDPVLDDQPTTLEAFIQLRDRVFAERRARIQARRADEETWFRTNVLPLAEL